MAVRRHRRRSARLALPLRLFSVEDIRPKCVYALLQAGQCCGIHAAALIRDLGKKRGIIILTDSDAAGFQLRNYIQNFARGAVIKHAYIPAVQGKEKRKKTPSKEGTLGVEEARKHPQRKVVTQALGVTDPAHMDIEQLTGAFTSGMQLLLCSDGLTEEVDDAAIAEILARPGLTAQESADTLVAAALDNGGSDNITVLVLRCH